MVSELLRRFEGRTPDTEFVGLGAVFLGNIVCIESSESLGPALSVKELAWTPGLSWAEQAAVVFDR